jgi:hypothetical protein
MAQNGKHLECIEADLAGLTSEADPFSTMEAFSFSLRIANEKRKHELLPFQAYAATSMASEINLLLFTGLSGEIRCFY